MEGYSVAQDPRPLSLGLTAWLAAMRQVAALFLEFLFSLGMHLIAIRLVLRAAGQRAF